MKHGFSLVELSIVLVILGLLVGGVLGGQSLIKAAELRSISEEQKEYFIAINAFKNKYRGLPGDLRNAGKFWGYANEDGADGGCDDIGTAYDAANPEATCDGDGNGLIETEQLRFWQQLGNAGMVTGTYKGAIDSTETFLDIQSGVHLPAAKYNGGMWMGMALETLKGNENAFLLMGGTDAVTYFKPIISSEDAWNIDSKFDDGIPGKGNILSLCDAVGPPVGPIPASAEYDLQQTTPNCVIGFIF